MEAVAEFFLELCRRCGGPCGEALQIVPLTETLDNSDVDFTKRCDVVLREILAKLRTVPATNIGSNHEISTLLMSVRGAGNPYVRLIANAVRGGDGSGADCDGGWLTLYLICKMTLLAGSVRGDMRWSWLRVVEGLNIVAQWLGELLREPRYFGMCAMKTSPALLRHVAATQLTAAHAIGMSPDDAAYVALHIVDALLRTLSTGSFEPSRIRIQAVCGSVDDADDGASGGQPGGSSGGAFGARLVDGIVIDWQLPLEAQILFQRASDGGGFMQGSKAVLFSCGIGFDRSADGVVQPVNRAHLDSFYDTIVQHNIKLVCSQRVIAPDVKYSLFRKGVVPLERLSIRHISAVQRALGCKVLTSLTPSQFTKESISGCSQGGNGLQPIFGTVGALKELHYHNKRYMCLSSETHSAHNVAHTLMLFAPTPQQAALLEANATACYAQLGAMVRAMGGKQSCVVPGGGCFELFVKQYLLHRLVGVQDVALRRNLAPAVCIASTALQSYVEEIVVRTSASHAVSTSTQERKHIAGELSRKVEQTTNFFLLANTVAGVGEVCFPQRPSTLAQPSSESSKGRPALPPRETTELYQWPGFNCVAGRIVVVATGRSPVDDQNNKEVDTTTDASKPAHLLPSVPTCEVPSGGTLLSDTIIDDFASRRESLLAPFAFLSSALLIEEVQLSLGA